MVTGKDEEAWWKGECNGKTGVFPSNYVEPAKCKYFLCIFVHMLGHFQLLICKPKNPPPPKKKKLDVFLENHIKGVFFWILKAL